MTSKEAAQQAQIVAEFYATLIAAGISSEHARDFTVLWMEDVKRQPPKVTAVTLRDTV